MNDEDMGLWPGPALAHLNVHEINWSAYPDPLNCTRCTHIIPDHPVPVQCSYASTLAHIEQVLGPLPDKRVDIRLMMLFQDPPQQLPVDVCHPLGDPMGVGEGESRYFCMTQTGWESLLLHRWTGDPIASWPTDESAYHFLRRYFRVDGQWSYEGIITYFLWLLRPAEAYITNHAKCNFGVWPQPKEVFETCGKAHLRREIELFRPNIILSFTFRIAKPVNLQTWCGLQEQDIAVLRFPHPATDTDKVGRVREALEANAVGFEDLGYDVDDLIQKWMRDATAARDSDEQPPDPPEVCEDMEFDDIDLDDLFPDDLCDTDKDSDDSADEPCTGMVSTAEDRVAPIDSEIGRVTVNGKPGTVLQPGEPRRPAGCAVARQA